MRMILKPTAFCMVLLTCTGFFPELNAQPKVGINTTTPLALLHVKDSSVLFSGPPAIVPFPFPDPPTSGAGIRMMWYPRKAAFRVGFVDDDAWDRDNIGLYSFASGHSTKATAGFATAMGLGAEAKGSASVSMGSGTVADADFSVALGVSARTTYNNSISIGTTTRASGQYATAMGAFTIARSYNSFAIGRYNDTVSTQASGFITWIDTDPLFMVGNGTSGSNRSNAMTILKNGNTGIGLSNPVRTLHVSGTTTLTGITPHTDAAIVLEKDNTNAYFSILTDTNRSAGIVFGNQFNSSDGGIYYNTLVSGESTFDLRFRTNGNNTRMTIDSIGNVGIGTTQPEAKLNVIGTVKILGSFNLDGELQRPGTGFANLVPICYGTIASAGSIFSGSGNFSVVHGGTGLYHITISDENYIGVSFTTSVTPYSASARMTSASQSGGNLLVRMFDAAGALVNDNFHFVVYKQ